MLGINDLPKPLIINTVAETINPPHNYLLLKMWAALHLGNKVRMKREKEGNLKKSVWNT